MFKTLYRCPRTVARHENGPLAESRRHYLEHLASQGASLHTIRAAAGVFYRAIQMLKLDHPSPVEREDVERAAKRWAHRWYRNACSRGPDRDVERRLSPKTIESVRQSMRKVMWSLDAVRPRRRAVAASGDHMNQLPT